MTAFSDIFCLGECSSSHQPLPRHPRKLELQQSRKQDISGTPQDRGKYCLSYNALSVHLPAHCQAKKDHPRLKYTEDDWFLNGMIMSHLENTRRVWKDRKSDPDVAVEE